MKLRTLAKIDILALNRSESDALVPVLVAKCGEGGAALTMSDGEFPPALAVRGLAGGGYGIGLRPFLRALGELGPRYVLFTDGNPGAFVGTRDEILFCPVIQTNVVGAAGAGDAFAATFATEITLGRPPADALRAATLNAAEVLGFVDTQSGLLRRDALDARLEHSRITFRCGAGCCDAERAKGCRRQSRPGQPILRIGPAFTTRQNRWRFRPGTPSDPARGSMKT